MADWRTLGKVWLAQIRYSVTRDLIFQSNFLLWVFVEALWMTMQFLFVEVIYSHIDSIAGWSKYQMLLLIGTHYLVMNIFQTFFMVNLSEIPELVRTGHMDFFLLQPVGPQFLLSTRKFDLSSLVNALIAAGLCFYAALRLDLQPGPAELAAYLLLLCAGVAIHYSLLLAGVTLAFWITKTEGVMHGYYQIMTLSRIPRDAFRGLWKYVFSTILPVLLVANVPASVLLDKGSWPLIFCLVVVAVIFFLVASAWFRLGLSQYKSASS
jgi:ABC-2 type transport system permease protein